VGSGTGCIHQLAIESEGGRGIGVGDSQSVGRHDEQNKNEPPTSSQNHPPVHHYYRIAVTPTLDPCRWLSPLYRNVLYFTI
jgi:hypothetical protein